MPAKIQLAKAIELPDRSFGFAGKIENKIMLNKYTAPLYLFETGYSLNQLDSVKIELPSEFKNRSPKIYKDVVSSHIVCTNLYGDISRFDGRISKYYKYRKTKFDYFQVVSPTSIVVRSRTRQQGLGNRSIAKLLLSDTVSLTKEFSLPDEINSYFTNDGVLYLDKENFRILYMYYYKGEFLSLDTNLNLLYKSKTIDTVRKARIKTSLIYKKRKNSAGTTTAITQSAPPKFVNASITTYKDRIYIASRLKADNETQSSFDKNQPVDIYNINSGKYERSFYIPRYNGEKIRQFQIKENILVALYATFLVTYTYHE